MTKFKGSLLCHVTDPSQAWEQIMCITLQHWHPAEFITYIKQKLQRNSKRDSRNYTTGQRSGCPKHERTAWMLQHWQGTEDDGWELWVRGRGEANRVTQCWDHPDRVRNQMKPSLNNFKFHPWLSTIPPGAALTQGSHLWSPAAAAPAPAPSHYPIFIWMATPLLYHILASDTIKFSRKTELEIISMQSNTFVSTV